MNRSAVSIAFFVATALFLIPGISVGADSPRQQRGVLVLSSVDPDVPEVSALFDEAQSEIQASATPTPLHFDLDYLSPSLFADDPSGQKKILPFLQHKYRGQVFDVVIAIGEQSLDFAERVRPELFPGADLVFVLINPAEVKDWQAAKPGRTGVIEIQDYTPTLRVALRQNPNTRRVIVIIGSSETEKLQMKSAQDQFRSFGTNVEFEYWSSLRLLEMAGRLKTLDQNSVVLMLNLLTDGSGEEFIPERALAVLAKAANRPVYSPIMSLVGNGAVGGSVVDMREVAGTVGRSTRRMLNGQRPESIPVLTGDFQRYVFDWRQMQKWGIPERQLPPGAALIERSYSAWESYRWRFIGLLAALLAQTALILVLLHLRRDRQRAQESLQTEKAFTDAVRDSIPGLLYVFDGEGHPVAWNKKSEEITGYSADEIKKSQPFEWFDTKDKTLVARTIQRALAEEHASTEANVRTKRGQKVPFFLTAVRVTIDGTPHCTGVGIDITDLKNVEKELERSNRQNALILESAGEGILGIDLEGNHTFVNPAAARMFGYESKELLGRCSHSTWHHTRLDGTPYPREECPIYAAFRDGIVHRGTGEMFWRKDGTRFCADYVSTPIQADGDVIGAVLVFQDTTDRVQAVERLRISEEKFSKLFRASPIIITVATLDDDRLVEVNEVFEQATGYTRSEAVDRTPGDLNLWSNPAEIENHFHGPGPRGNLRNVECRFRVRNGDVRDGLLSSEVIEVDGRPCALTSVMDITDRKRAEEALRESEARFRLMADSAPVLMWLSGSDTHRIDFNKEWLRFTGRSYVQEIGDGWLDNVHEDDRHRCKNLLARPTKNGESIRLEYRLRRHDGQYRWVLDHAVPRFLNDGTFAGYIGCCADISDQKEAENTRTLMTGRLINAQEEERARIARELHDDINQRMALLANGFRQLNQTISQNRAGLVESERLFQLTTEISAAVQELSHELHSSKLDYLGLAAAVRSLCHDFATTHNVEVDCCVRDLPSNLQYQVTLNIFRCIQEALRNVGKHSKAMHAKVELTGGPNVVRLRVSDDGIGFDPNDPINRSGLGIVSMGERLKWIGGEFSVWSKPAIGTQIEGSVPIPANQEHAATSLAG